jgi:hypothetical protein
MPCAHPCVSLGLKKPGDFTVSEGHRYPLVTIITLEPCALNAEFLFHSEISINFITYFADTNERGDRG